MGRLVGKARTCQWTHKLLTPRVGMAGFSDVVLQFGGGGKAQ